MPSMRDPVTAEDDPAAPERETLTLSGVATGNFRSFFASLISDPDKIYRIWYNILLKFLYAPTATRDTRLSYRI